MAAVYWAFLWFLQRLRGPVTGKGLDLAP